VSESVSQIHIKKSSPISGWTPVYGYFYAARGKDGLMEEEPQELLLLVGLDVIKDIRKL
jgi:hypothetical protein